MPNLAKNQQRLDIHYIYLVEALEEAEINTPARIAAFLAQVAHESYEFKYMSEVWGPTDAQKRYEPPNPLAKKLGNTQPGDGFRYRGAGPIQLTGRANYRACGKDLGLDLEGNPDQAHTPAVGHRIAAWYWRTRNLNALADAKQFDAITKKVNGGFNGKSHRDQYYAKACEVLNVT
jgi:predicted chitinase